MPAEQLRKSLKNDHELTAFNEKIRGTISGWVKELLTSNVRSKTGLVEPRKLQSTLHDKWLSLDVHFAETIQPFKTNYEPRGSRFSNRAFTNKKKRAAQGKPRSPVLSHILGLTAVDVKIENFGRRSSISCQAPPRTTYNS